MPVVSEAQRRAMFAAAAGHSTLGIPQAVGKEFTEADPGGKLPKAKDMARTKWVMLKKLFGEWISEEEKEPKHGEDVAPQPRAASVMFTTPVGEVLLLRRSATEENWPDTWAFPGGKVDDGETLETGAQRESQEETGFAPDANDLELAEQKITPYGWEHTTFRVAVPEQFTPILNAEHSAFVWATPAEAPEPLHPGVKATLASLDHSAEDVEISPLTTEPNSGIPSTMRQDDDAPTHVLLGGQQVQRSKATLQEAARKARLRGREDLARRAEDTAAGLGEDAEFEESKHPRGQPGNSGQFGQGGGGGSPASLENVVLHSSVSPKLRKLLGSALQYLSVRDVQGLTMHEISGREGIAGSHLAGQKIIMLSSDIKRPQTLATVLKHESIHSKQPGWMSPFEREEDAYAKTVLWADNHAKSGSKDADLWRELASHQRKSWERSAPLYRKTAQDATQLHEQTIPPDWDTRAENGSESGTGPGKYRMSNAVKSGRGLANVASDMAFDFESVRSKDADGRMHVSTAHISKAAVNEYLGSEINAVMQGEPGWRMLEPGRRYKLWRHPDELKRAVDTFNHIPIQDEHVAFGAANHQPEHVIGATGTSAVYNHPYLDNALVFWPQASIDKIEDGDTRELSSGYRYKADMTPGATPEGDRYDGVMRDLCGSHVALVREGRAGSDVAVGDSSITEQHWRKIEHSLLAIA